MLASSFVDLTPQITPSFNSITVPDQLEVDSDEVLARKLQEEGFFILTSLTFREQKYSLSWSYDGTLSFI